MLRLSLAVFSILFVCLNLIAQDTIHITPDNFGPRGDYKWTANSIYQLQGDLVLEQGELVVEPGTHIIIDTTFAQETGLTIGPRARLLSLGEKEEPIYFRLSEESYEYRAVDGLPHWKGIIIRQNDDSPSSTLRYVSIIKAGSADALGAGAALQLENMHDRNTIEFVEVHDSEGDGIRIWGGKVNISNTFISYVLDDAYSWNYGWQGFGMFWAATDYSGISNMPNGSHLLEGLGEPGTNGQIADPKIFHATLVGGFCREPSQEDPRYSQAQTSAVFFGRGTRGILANSIIGHFNDRGIEVEDTPGTSDSRTQLEEGNLQILSNIWTPIDECTSDKLVANSFCTGPGGLIVPSPQADDPEAQFLVDHLKEQGNYSSDLGLINNSLNSFEGCYNFDPRLCQLDPNWEPAIFPDPWFTMDSHSLDYAGAFSNTEFMWTYTWTYAYFNFGQSGFKELIYINGDNIRPLKDGDTLRLSCAEYLLFQQNLFFSREDSIRSAGRRCFPPIVIGVVATARKGNRRRRPQRKDFSFDYAFQEEWTYFNPEGTNCLRTRTPQITVIVIDTIPPEIVPLPNEQGGFTPYIRDCDEAYITDSVTDTIMLANGGMRIQYSFSAVDISGNQSEKTVELIKASPLKTYFADLDSDGLGNASQAIEAFVAPSGFVFNADDCNDYDPNVTIPCPEDQEPDACFTAPHIMVRTDNLDDGNGINLQTKNPSFPYTWAENCGSNPGFADSWVKFTPLNSEGVRVTLFGDPFFPAGQYHVELFSGPCEELVFERCLDTLEESYVEDFLSLDIIDLDTSKIYYLRFQELYNFSNYFEVNIFDLVKLPANSQCRFAQELQWEMNGCSIFNYTPDDYRQDLWYIFNDVSGDSMTFLFEFLGLDFNLIDIHEFSFYELNSCEDLSWIDSYKISNLGDNRFQILLYDLPDEKPLAIRINSPYQIRMTTCHFSQVVSNLEQIKSQYQIEIFPNPAKTSTTLWVNLPSPQEVRAVLYDLSGKPIQTILSKTRVEDFHAASINLTNLPKGIYFLRLETVEQIFFRKIIHQ